MYRLLPAAAALLLAADVATAQDRQRDAFDDWQEPRARYVERYRPPHEADTPVRRENAPPGWQVSPRDWREAEQAYGYRPAPGWPFRRPAEPERPEPRYDQRSYDAAPPVRRETDPYAPRPAHLDRAHLDGAPPPDPRRYEPEPSREWRRAAPTPSPAPLYDRGGDYEQPRGQAVMSGGPRPPIAPLAPERIPFVSRYAPGTIVIETAGRQLLLVVSRHEALRYPISVGRQGFAWTGSEKIRRIADWPDWHPPASMRQREPYLPLRMTGGIRNPLGAKALYLGNSLYRIHGTNDARTIGLASSSGCFRMLNGHVVDLASRVGVGTAVVVVDRLPRTIGASRAR